MSEAAFSYFAGGCLCVLLAGVLIAIGALVDPVLSAPTQYAIGGLLTITALLGVAGVAHINNKKGRA